jgi:hypothetical protein
LDKFLRFFVPHFAINIGSKMTAIFPPNNQLKWCFDQISATEFQSTHDGDDIQEYQADASKSYRSELEECHVIKRFKVSNCDY